VTGPTIALILVQADAEDRWRVRLPGAGKSRQFVDRTGALSYAKAWASANRPSTMHVSGIGGNFTQAWSFR
jgi:hypothetical protein